MEKFFGFLNFVVDQVFVLLKVIVLSILVIIALGSWVMVQNQGVDKNPKPVCERSHNVSY